MKTQRNKNLLLLILLILLVSNTAFAGEGTISLKSQPLSNIKVDGNNAVWMASLDGNWDIYHLDLSIGIETRITNDPNTQGHPDIWQNYIVWDDNRNHIEDGTRYFDIYLYDMEKKTEERISTVEGDHREPIIKNNKVVWVDHKYGNKDVMIYDIQNKTLERVSADGAQAFGLSFDGSIIAWMDRRGKSFDIYIYDTSKREEKQITYGLGDESEPIVSDGKVVWMVGHDGFSQIYMYDTQTELKTKLTVGQENHRPIAFENDKLLVIENDRLILNTVDRITENPIISTSGTIPKQAFIENDRVVWFDGKNLSIDSIKSALDRKLDDETTKPIINDRDNSTVVEKNKDEKNKTLIKANEDTLVTSEDGILTLKFLKGSFDKDTYVTLTQNDKLQRANYSPVSSVYSWETEGNKKPLFPIEASMNYSNIKTNDNPKKICIYTLNNDNSLKIIRSKRNHEQNIITAKIKNENSLALMTYKKTFTDLTSHWAKETVDIISSHQVINGYNDGSFKPNKEMTRAEFVKVLVSSVCTEEEILSYGNKNIFNDVSSDFWAVSYINIASQKGWVSGYNESFNPNQSITREQMITILMRVYQDIVEEKQDNQQTGAELSTYSDTGKISAWAYESMREAVETGVIQGSNNELQPLKNATRAEAATILYRYLDRIQRL